MTRKESEANTPMRTFQTLYNTEILKSTSPSPYATLVLCPYSALAFLIRLNHVKQRIGKFQKIPI